VLLDPCPFFSKLLSTRWELEIARFARNSQILSLPVYLAALTDAEGRKYHDAAVKWSKRAERS